MRILSRSIVGKMIATLIAMIAFVWLYQTTTHDSLLVTGLTPSDPNATVAGARLAFTATAYCKGTTTASGVGPRTGVAAADPAVLPVGSVVTVTTDTAKYNGIYTVMDTGPKVQGRRLDLYIWSCYEALDFGRKAAEVSVLRLGWNPSQSTPSLVDRLFRRRDTARRQALETAAAERRAQEAVPVPTTSPAVTPPEPFPPPPPPPSVP